jgi:hypothetical protein
VNIEVKIDSRNNEVDCFYCDLFPSEVGFDMVKEYGRWWIAK